MHTRCEYRHISHNVSIPTFRRYKRIPDCFRRGARSKEKDGVQGADDEGGDDAEPEEAFTPHSQYHDPQDKQSHGDSADGDAHDGEWLTDVEYFGNRDDSVQALVLNQVVKVPAASVADQESPCYAQAR